MRGPDRTQVHGLVPLVALASAAGLGVVDWRVSAAGGEGLEPGPFVLAAFWLLVEWRMMDGDPSEPTAREIHMWHRVVFAALGLFIASVHAVGIGVELGVVREVWLPSVRRSLGMTAGIMVAMWGNYLPKLVSPWPPHDEPFDWQGVHRIVGWTASVGGIAIAVGWLALPFETAATVSRWVGVGVGVSALGIKLGSVVTHSVRAGRS
jgi:hypothetical protein